MFGFTLAVEEAEARQVGVGTGWRNWELRMVIVDGVQGFGKAVASTLLSPADREKAIKRAIDEFSFSLVYCHCHSKVQ